MENSYIIGKMNGGITIFEFFRSIFMDIVSMDSLVIKIMGFAQKLVNADRASLFLVDPKSNQLYARLFDVTEEKSKYKYQDISKEVRYKKHNTQTKHSSTCFILTNNILSMSFRLEMRI